MEPSRPAQPPLLANWLATKLIDDSIQEEVLGDLKEIFEDRVEARGRTYAASMYWLDVLHLIFGMSARRDERSQQRNSTFMNTSFFRNYFRIFTRRLINDSSTSWINFIGLVSGIAVCLLILVYVIDEASFNRFYPDAEKTYRLYSRIEFEKGKPIFNVASPYMSSEVILARLEGTDAVLNLGNVPRPILTPGDESFYETNVRFADQNVFEFFPFKFIAGSPETALTTPESMVVTTTIAKKYFGTEDAIGKTVTLRFANVVQDMSITGVIEDAPHNSTIQANIIISSVVFEKINRNFRDAWTTIGWQTYFRLKDGYTMQQVESELETFISEKAGKKKFYSSYLQPLTDLHLNTGRAPVASLGNYNFLLVLGSVGVFILILACSNYINLTTSRSSLRDKEIALRKVNGARRTDLIGQFYLECALFCTMSFLFAAIVVFTLLPVFNNITDKQIPYSFLLDKTIVTGFVSTLIVTIMLSGGYPALMLAKRTALIDSLRSGKGRVSQSRFPVRQFLVAFQMIIASVLLICSLLIIQQVRFLSTKEIGIDKEQLLVIDLNNIELARKYQFLKTELTKLPGVRSASASNLAPLFGTGQISYTINGEHGVMNDIVVDEAFLKTYSIKIKDGRWLSADVATDINTAVVLNQAAVEEFGFTDPLGQKIKLEGNSVKEAEVVGVVKDFNYEPLFKKIEPLVMHIDTTDLGFYFPYSKLTLKLEKGSIAETMSAITMKWKEVAGFVPLSYNFFDESFDAAYKNEARMSWLLSSATLLAVVIVCLGLAGLSFFVAETRKREIAIRKVLGSGVWNIVSLLTSRYVKIMLISFCIAIPTAHYIMSKWLENFAFKAGISPVIYIASLLVLLALSWGLTALNTYRSAMTNPAKVLRN